MFPSGDVDMSKQTTLLASNLKPLFPVTSEKPRDVSVAASEELAFLSFVAGLKRVMLS